MLIIDRKGFRVMSILHRTYRVTRLRVIYLLNTRQGVWEKITEKVSDTEKFRTAESYRRERSSDKFWWYRKVVSGYTIKSNWFRHMPDNSWRVPESFWKLFGIFRNKNRKIWRFYVPAMLRGTCSYFKRKFMWFNVSAPCYTGSPSFWPPV